jgi:hypothetical protein
MEAEHRESFFARVELVFLQLNLGWADSIV